MQFEISDFHEGLMDKNDFEKIMQGQNYPVQDQSNLFDQATTTLAVQHDSESQDTANSDTTMEDFMSKHGGQNSKEQEFAHSATVSLLASISKGVGNTFPSSVPLHLHESESSGKDVNNARETFQIQILNDQFKPSYLKIEIGSVV